MCRTYSTHGEIKNSYDILDRKLKSRDQGVNGRTVLERILGK